MGWLVALAVALACALVACGAWLAGYARGMADAVKPMTEWYRRHAGDGDGE